MHRSTIVVGLLLSFGVSARGDYLSGRKAAAELGRTGKHQEAVYAFSNLVAEAKSDFQKSDALEQAAFWAGVLKQYDQAMAFAAQIPLPAARKNCRMKILCDTRKYADLIAEFKDEEIAAWPESLVGDGMSSRGTAYYALKQGTAAEADLKVAAEYMTDSIKRASALLTLGNNYRNNLQDDAHALDAYARIIAMNLGGYHVALSAVLSSADILRKQGRYDAAFDMLGSIDISKMSGYWLGVFLAAHAEILASEGKKAEAIAKWMDAAAVNGMPASQKAMYEKRLAEFQGGGK